MSKHESREASRAIGALPILGADYVARILSALHRASLRNKAKQEIAELARQHGVDQSPEWIICS